MKKIMVMAAAAVLAATTHAAAFGWSVAQVQTVAGTGAASNYLAVYMIGDATDLSSLETALAKGDTSGVVTTYSKAVSNGTASQSMQGSLSAGDSQSGYVVIFDATSLDKAEHYLVAKDTNGNSVLTRTVGTGGGNITFAWGSQASNTNWKAVPEPTSGLLMLLGMAGLALRRRRA